MGVRSSPASPRMLAGGVMSLLDMKDYGPAARRYWWTITALGYAVVAYAIYTVAGYDWPVLVQVLGGATVAAVVALFPVRIPGTKTSIAGGEIFIFLALLLYGIEGAVLAAALEGLVGSWRTSKRWTSRIGTPAMTTLSILIAGAALTAIRAHVPDNAMGKAALLSGMLLLGVLYFAGNTLLTSTLIALKNGAPLRPFAWWRSLGWVAMAYMASASIAGLLFASFERFGVPVLLVSVPLITMFLSTLHSY